MSSSSTLDEAPHHAPKENEVDERALHSDPTSDENGSASHSDEDRAPTSDEKRAAIPDEEKGMTKSGPPAGPPPLVLPAEAYLTLVGGWIALFCSFG